MITGLNRLTPLDWIVVVAGLWLVVLIPQLEWPFAEKDQSRAEFRAAWAEAVDGHAAFAEGDGQSYGWTSGYYSQAAAMEDAMVYCRRVSKGCEIVQTRSVTRQPAGVDVHLSAVAMAHFTAYQAQTGPKAFAISPSGAVGYAYGKATLGAARLSALKTCQTYDAIKDADIPKRRCSLLHQAP